MNNIILSVHDVMPDTLDSVTTILQRLKPFRISDIYLLVVPGLEWTQQDISRLKQLQAKGYQLAGHGKQHHVQHIHGFYHKLHSRVISNQVAEHLALNEKGIIRLIQDCYAWFPENRLQPAKLYVPPAWAMGNISRKALNQLPFRWYEFIHGIYNNETQNFHYLPLAGYEAQNRLDQVLISLWNKINQRLSSERHPLRFSIHPNDFNLCLQGELNRAISISDTRTYSLNKVIGQ